MPLFTLGDFNQKCYDLVPSSLDFIDGLNSCPGTQYLDGSGAEIEVYLFDAFGTLVKGLCLEDVVLMVNLSYTGNVELSVSNSSSRLSPETGGALFSSVLLQGHNNSTARLTFTALDSEYYYGDIASIGCSISLLDCPSGYRVEPGDLVDTCKEGELTLVSVIIKRAKIINCNSAEVNYVAISSIVLSSIILILLLILCLVIGTYITLRIRLAIFELLFEQKF